MATINGLPIIWENNDDSFLRNLFGETRSLTGLTGGFSGENERSLFQGSPFGPNWHLDNRYRNSTPPGIMDREENDRQENEYPEFKAENCRLLLVLHGEADAMHYWNENLEVPSSAIAAFILAKRNFWLKDYQGVEKNVKVGVNFTGESVERIFNVHLGKTIVEQEVSGDDLEKLVQLLVEWLFVGDKDAQDTFFPELYQMALKYYQTHHEYKLSTFEKIIKFLAWVLQPILWLVRKFIKLILDALAALLRELKITNPKYWIKGHRGENGEEYYIPFFFP